jgi:hypothetical protein
LAAVIRSPNFVITLDLISSFFGRLTFVPFLWFINAGPDQVRIGHLRCPDRPGYTQKDILLEDSIVIFSRREKV